MFIKLRMGTLKNVLIDLSGTLHVGNQSTPGAVEALRKLREAGLKIKFVTNTTKESKSLLLRRLEKIGFDIREGELFSSLTAARELILRDSLRPMLMIDERAMEDFEGLEASEGNENAVVVGLAPDKFGYRSMNVAMRSLLRGNRLVALNDGRYYKTEDGLSLGAALFVRALRTASSVEPEIVGKPSEAFFRAALGGCPPSEAVMVGDDVKDDIIGASLCGIRGYLVRTGKFRDSDADDLPPSARLCDDFSDAVRNILSSSD